MATWDHVEAELSAAWERQLALYSQALAIAECLDGQDPAADLLQAKLQKITDVLQETASVQKAVEQLSATWGKANRHAGQRLQDAKKNVAEAVSRLQSTIARLEEQAVAARDRLLPKIDDLVRGQQMQRAYAAAKRLVRG
jgi:predicted  nucleic acid-binding Zn-ribbon protein